MPVQPPHWHCRHLECQWSGEGKIGVQDGFRAVPVPKLEVVEAGVFGKNGALPGAFVLA